MSSTAQERARLGREHAPPSASALASVGTGLSAGLAPLLACRLLLGAGTSLSMAGFPTQIPDQLERARYEVLADAVEYEVEKIKAGS